MKITVSVSGSEPDKIAEELATQVTVVPSANDIDYSFRNDCNLRAVFIERKEASDLLHSFVSGAESGESRLMNQLRKMAEKAGPGDLCVLLKEGHINNQGGYAAVGRRKSQIPYDAIDNFLIAVQGFGFRIAHSHSQKYTAARLLSIAKKWLGDESSGPIIRLPRAPRPQLRTLMTFPGVGAKRAKQMLEETGALKEALWNLMFDKAGLGDKRQARVRDYLEEAYRE
jgi:ERCC4-type nuclease